MTKFIETQDGELFNVNVIREIRRHTYPKNETETEYNITAFIYDSLSAKNIRQITLHQTTEQSLHQSIYNHITFEFLTFRSCR